MSAARGPALALGMTVVRRRHEARHHPRRRAGRRRRRRAVRLDRRRRAKPGAGRAGDADPGRRAAHRRHDLLSRGDAARRARCPPVLALNPAIGEVDVALATELLEAGRMIFNGFVTPDRTTLIASTHRVLSIGERAAMGDGSFDVGRLLRAVKERSKEQILFDMDQAAEESGGVINAVLLGALAGSGRLPIPDAGLRGRHPTRRQVGRHQPCGLRLRPRPRARRARAGRARAPQAPGGGAAASRT